MDNIIKVSFVMPSYNTPEEYLKESIGSVLNQSYKNLELIIIDDGSSENNWEVIKEYASRDDRIRLLQNERNCGIAYSLNRGLSQASGDYIFRMDSDDICEYDRVKTTLEYMESHPEVDIVGSQFKYFPHKKLFNRRSHFPEENEDIKINMLVLSPFCHPTVCFRKKSIERLNLKYDPQEKAEDYQLWVEAAIHGGYFSNIHKPLLKYRIHNKQVTHDSMPLLESASRTKKRLMKYLGIDFDEKEWNLYQKFCFGPITSDEMKDVDVILLKKIMESIPESYAKHSVVQKVFSQRYYHECLRLALKGDAKIAKTFSSSMMSKCLGKKQIKTLVLRIGCLFSGRLYNMFIVQR